MMTDLKSILFFFPFQIKKIALNALKEVTKFLDPSSER